MIERPFAVGLQPERTLLAWRRTALSVAVGALLIMRFALDQLGPFAFGFGIVGMLLSCVAYVMAAQRYSGVHLRLTRMGDLPSVGPAVTAVTMGVAASGGVCVLWLIGGTR